MHYFLEFKTFNCISTSIGLYSLRTGYSQSSSANKVTLFAAEIASLRWPNYGTVGIMLALGEQRWANIGPTMYRQHKF